MASTTGIQPHGDDKASLKGRHVESVVDNEKRPASDTSDEEISEEDNVRLRRRIDWFIMPLLCLVYGLQYLDKTGLSYASIMGIIPDTKMTLANYSWLGTIFYFGFLAGEYPLTYALQRWPIAKVTGLTIIIWGVVLGCMAACKDYKGLLVVRFFLGFFESSITPALTIFTAQWYRTSEHSFRTGMWYSTQAGISIFGGLVSYGFAKAGSQHKLSLASWRAVLLLFAAMTVATGIAFFFLIPDNVETAWFLSERDRKLAKIRTKENQLGVVDKTWKWYQVREALLDPAVWLLCLVSLCLMIPSGGLLNFYGIVVSQMGFTSHQTLLLSLAGSWNIFSVLFFPWLAGKYGYRALISIMPCGIALAGSAMVWGCKGKIARFVGYNLGLGYAATFALSISLLTSNVAGRTKKTFVNGMFLIAFCAGNLIGPQTFREKDKPKYVPALTSIVVLYAFSMFLMVVVHFLYKNRNSKRMWEEGHEPVANDVEDLTDRENPHFHYAL
ncbi:Allantoate permease [Vanrija albida]|uniref:Allantoate permease n=1 Tax=Vanrija albida TaxID=181172 RepID=A0ABR3Q4Q6_9TREE